MQRTYKMRAHTHNFHFVPKLGCDAIINSFRVYFLGVCERANVWTDGELEHTFFASSSLILTCRCNIQTVTQMRDKSWLRSCWSYQFSYIAFTNNWTKRKKKERTATTETNIKERIIRDEEEFNVVYLNRENCDQVRERTRWNERRMHFLNWIESLSSSEPWIITPSGGKSFDSFSIFISLFNSLSLVLSSFSFFLLLLFPFISSSFVCFSFFHNIFVLCFLMSCQSYSIHLNVEALHNAHSSARS